MEISNKPICCALNKFDRLIHVHFQLNLIERVSFVNFLYFILKFGFSLKFRFFYRKLLLRRQLNFSMVFFAMEFNFEAQNAKHMQKRKTDVLHLNGLCDTQVIKCVNLNKFQTFFKT